MENLRGSVVQNDWGRFRNKPGWLEPSSRRGTCHFKIRHYIFVYITYHKLFWKDCSSTFWLNGIPNSFSLSYDNRLIPKTGYKKTNPSWNFYLSLCHLSHLISTILQTVDDVPLYRSHIKVEYLRCTLLKCTFHVACRLINIGNSPIVSSLQNGCLRCLFTTAPTVEPWKQKAAWTNGKWLCFAICIPFSILHEQGPDRHWHST